MADLNSTISLTNAMDFIKEFGFFEVVLPLILVFSIFYGILIVTKIFGDPDDKTRPLYAIISFVAAFFVIASTDVVRMINEIIPSAALLLMLAVLVLMFMGVFGFNREHELLKGKSWFTKLGVVILIIIFLGVVDMSLESIDIPVIHEMSSAFIDTGEGDETSSTEAGESIIGGGMSDEQMQYLGNIAILLAFMVGLPIAVIYFIVHKPGGA